MIFLFSWFRVGICWPGTEKLPVTYCKSTHYPAICYDPDKNSSNSSIFSKLGIEKSTAANSLLSIQNEIISHTKHMEIQNSKRGLSSQSWLFWGRRWKIAGCQFEAFDLCAYLIFVTGTTGAARVKISVRCKFFQIERKKKHVLLF